ncbi:MAG: 3-deoxy-D-manno-octulosonic acid transferase [Rhodospirillaceae bacterium]|nr:3-deoxy-D-manno-octulosonic acid transferase [Rhodospirillaceae bacterium]|tara:strand:+ start:3449 stop:4732 length:1284 start_codon:yes stop_codon:yes gene_type:complete
MIRLVYEIIMTLALPFIELLLLRRIRQGKEDYDRLNERRGISRIPRPEGQLIWLHASSVGESITAVALIEQLLKTSSERNILVTTGTVTSARLMSDRLPDRAFHQFVPIDRPTWVKKFFHHWHPELVLIMESEFWPVQIKQAHKLGIPVVMINARLSRNSFTRWRFITAFKQPIFETINLVIATNAEQAKRFNILGAQNVVVSGNLKRSAQKLPFDISMVEKLAKQINNRPVFLAASTHDGEDLPVLEATKKLLNKFPRLLTVIVPRHPPRSNEIELLGSRFGLRMARRTKGDGINEETELYIADTIGEMAIFFHIAHCVFVAGSLVPVGGHNPVEAAHFRCAVIFGPLMAKNQEIADEMVEENAAIKINNSSELFSVLNKLLKDKEKFDIVTSNALKYAETGGQVLQTILTNLEPFIRDDVGNAGK